MNIPDSYFEGSPRILDVGGWFIPEPRATHVVDLMPWETRGARLSPAPLPGERFSKATWFQADFLSADFRLPFADKDFDLVLCGHTIEDLVNPEPLLREMQRVGIRGIIECPSRITEQTQGIRDRETTLPGHPHHHWIVESTDGCLVLYSKEDSALQTEKRLLPLLLTERRLEVGVDQRIVVHHWQNEILFSIVKGTPCQKRAEAFVKSLGIRPLLRTKDRLLRFARRARTRLKGVRTEDPMWWSEMLDLSRPYSHIKIQ